MDINIIGVPLMYGSGRYGVQFGPDRLRELGIIEIFEEQGHNVYDLGNIFVPNVLDEDKYKAHSKMKYLDPIKTANKNLGHLIYMSLKTNAFPLVIGGDHSIGMGSIAGSSKYYDSMAVIWVDAHGDINDWRTSPSGNIHGMPLAASMGIGHPKLTDIYYPEQKINPSNVYIVGARDLDPGEIKLAEELDLNLYTMDMIKSKGLDNILNDMLSKIDKSQVEGVHLSYDIDVMDESIVPGTGTPVKDGLSLDEGKDLLKGILNRNIVTSMDFVELNPELDNKDKQTEKTCIKLLKTINKYLYREILKKTS